MGLFFDDAEEVACEHELKMLKLPPPTPDTGWRRPSTMPDLRNAKVIAFDVETKEPDFKYGPGWARGVGHIVGVSVAAISQSGERFKAYYPVRHELGNELNFNPATIFDWLRVQLQTPKIPKVGANLMYDIGWLTTENIFVEGELHDVQYAEALLNDADNAQVNLEFLGKKYVGEGKDSGAMYDWIMAAYRPNKKALRGEIYRTSPMLVGYYAEQDAELPLQVIEKQLPIIHEQGLDFLYRVECDLIYLLVRMRLAGVTIDLNFAESMKTRLDGEISVLYGKLTHSAGVVIDSVGSPEKLGHLFDALKVPYKKTATGRPSFTKEWLKACEHPIAAIINDIRELEKLRGTFIQGYLLDRNVNGKIYGNFHPLKGDGNGARTGRLSSSNPNLQNIPARSAVGKLIRKAFIRDEGHIAWEKNDYSQIEYRFLCHFAVGKGSDEVRQEYNANPDTDYHEFTQKLVKEKTGQTISRKPIKNINFGLLYGMGKAKLCRQLNLTKNQGDDMFKAYHEGAPYVKATMESASSEAAKKGYITTILNRRSRFELWEPSAIDYDDRALPLPQAQAVNIYGSNIQRAYIHKAINSRLQGSSADQMKLALWSCWRQGIFDVIGVPRSTVHDELNHSVISDSKEQNEGYEAMHDVMRTCIKIRVPVRIDTGRGPTWGDID